MTAAVLLEVCDLARSFGPTVALQACSFAIAPGEIHALVGENGSGKSTLIKILNGVLPPDRGELRWLGHATRFAGPRAARHAGIACSFQETLVVEDLSVRDNILLGQDGALLRARGFGGERAQATAALAELGIVLDLDRKVASLSLAQRQLITVARSLARPWRLLILDESTSALDARDRDALFEALLRFRGLGRSVLFVSHRMDEIARLADRATVLRGGRSVTTLAAHEAGAEALLRLMSGEAVAPHSASTQARQHGGVALEARGLVLRSGAAAIELAVAAGEIVGLAGLEGHGQVAFLEAVAGLSPAVDGSILAAGSPIRTLTDAGRARIGFLPRDRKRDGIFGSLSVADNLTISMLAGLARWGMLSRTRLRMVAREAIARLRVKAPDPDAPIATLSGGNQQKALLGRLLLTRPLILALNDPMRGVDPGAKHDLHETLRELAREGMAVLVLSTELSELCVACDRVAVFREHGLAAVLDRAEVSEARLIAAMFGRTSQ